jgi:hypothetical protein
MIPLQPSVRTHPASRGPQGAPQPKAPDHERQPPLPIFLQSSRLGSSPRFRRTVQSSDGRSHHASTARPPAPPVPPEGETDTKSEPQIRESGQCVVGLSAIGNQCLAVNLIAAWSPIACISRMALPADRTDCCCSPRNFEATTFGHFSSFGSFVRRSGKSATRSFGRAAANGRNGEKGR